MKDLKLIQYLRQHLRFGCVKYSLINESMDVNGKLLLCVSLFAFREFSELETIFIRNNVLESPELRRMSSFKLKSLNFSKTRIDATYKFD